MAAIDTAFKGTTDGDWNTGTNFTNGIPAVDEDVAILAQSTTDIDAYDASATAVSSIHVRRGFSQTIGAITDGVGGYLKLDLGGSGDWSSEAFLEGDGDPQLLYIENSGEINILHAGNGNAKDRTPALYLTGIDNDLVNMAAGASRRVGLAWLDEESFETDNLNVSSGEIYIGRGVTMKNGSSALPMTINGGTVVTQAPSGVITGNGGNLYVEDGNITELQAKALNARINGTVTVTDCSVRKGGVIDLEQGAGTVTWTNDVVCYAGAAFYDFFGRSSGLTIQFPDGIDKVKLRLAPGLEAAITAIS